MLGICLMEPSGRAVCLITQIHSRQRSSRYTSRGSAVIELKGDEIRNCTHYPTLLVFFSEHQVSQSSDVRIVAARASYRVPSSLQRSLLLSVDPELFQFISAASTSVELVSPHEHFLEYVCRCECDTKLSLAEHTPANRATLTFSQLHPDVTFRILKEIAEQDNLSNASLQRVKAFMSGVYT